MKRPSDHRRALRAARGARPTRATVFGLLAVAAILGCATAIPYGAVSLRVDSNVPDGTVWVDDALVGHVADWAKDGKHIRAGFHRIEIRHAGYYSYFQEIELPEGAHTIVKAQLHPLVE